MRRHWPACGAVIAAFALASLAYLSLAAPGSVHVSHFESVMGTSLEIKVQSRSDVAARHAEETVLTEIARLSKILSGYDSNSEFSRWFRSSAVPMKVSPELVEVMTAF